MLASGVTVVGRGYVHRMPIRAARVLYEIEL